MANTTTAICLPLFPSLEMAWRDVDSSFERFCLTAGIGAVEEMLREDAQQLTGAPHRRGGRPRRPPLGHDGGQDRRIGVGPRGVRLCRPLLRATRVRASGRKKSLAGLIVTPTLPDPFWITGDLGALVDPF